MPQSGSGRVAAGRQEPDDQKVANVAGRAFGQILPSKNSLPLSTLSKLQRHWCCGIAQPECQPVPVGMIDRLIASRRGRIFNTAGDSVLADFASVVDAVQCAVEVQDAMGKENANRIASQQMRFRIGVHVGDIIVQEEIFSRGVKIAV